METDLQYSTKMDDFPAEGSIPTRRNGVAIQAGLEKYSGEWNKKTAAHLLRRATFGPSFSDIEEFANYSLDEAIDKILNYDDEFHEPLNYSDENDPYVPIGESWVGAPYYAQGFGHRLNSFTARWFGNIVNSGNNVGEKMLLFWHNHFVTQMTVVRDENLTFKYYETLRNNTLGNFRNLTEEITIDPGMLRYLNGNENIVGRPNENYARELFELFTVGKGPLIAPGDYTNYTEDDVIAASKVLTGWRALRDSHSSRFYELLHDKSDKQFSEAFDNKVITNQGKDEYKALIDMILQQDETARFICRKLYRWFVYYEIDEQTESNVIEPMADILRSNDFEIKPVLRALFSSAHFYDEWNRGCFIKSPLDYVTSMYRALEVKFPDRFPNDYNSWYIFGFQYVALQEMTLGEPPSVAGWPAMYQEPSFHRLWLTTVSAPYRALLADALSLRGNLKQRRSEISYDPLELAEKTSKPYDPNQLVKDFAELFLPIEVTENQLEYLKDNLLPNGLEDYNWTAAWNEYLENPGNEENTKNVRTLIMLLIRANLNIAEFHLA